MIRSGLVSISFRKLSVTEIISAATTAKLAGIEWGGDIHVPHGDLKRAKEVAAQTRDHGLEIPCYGSYYRAGWQDPANPSVQAVIDTAAELGAPLVRIWAGRHGSAQTSSSQRQVVIDAIIECVRVAKEANIRVALEYHVNTLTDTFDSTVKLLESIPDPNLFTLWQPPLHSKPDENIRHIQHLLPRLAHLHVFQWSPDANGNVMRHELADGIEHWSAYLGAAKKAESSRYALLEFIKNDSLEQLYLDADTLHQLLRPIDGHGRP